jgi:hypothetical protein
MSSFIDKVVDGFINLDPFFSQIPKIVSSHSGPIRNVRIPESLDQKLTPIEIRLELKGEVIKNTQFEDFTMFLVRFADERNSSIARLFFEKMEKVATAVGNTVQAEGKPFSWDYVNIMLEKMYIEFDEEGQPKLPSLVMHPNLYEKVKEIKPTKEQEKTRAEIIERKRSEYNAQKRTRRLS